MATQSRVSMTLAPQKKRVKEQMTDLKLGNPELSIVHSVAFMKKLTVVAVSSIVFLRDVFPSEAFDEFKIAGQKIVCLKGNDDIPGTRTLIEWLKSAFDLVESHNLKKIILVLQKEQVTLETYSLTFTYDHQAILCDGYGEADGKEVFHEQSQGEPEEIAKSVRMLIRSIFAYTSLLQPLPKDCELSIKIVVDKDTPKDLIPHCFQNNPANDELNFPDEVNTTKLGKVPSKFITLAVTTKTVLNAEHEIISPSQEVDISADVDSEDEVPASQIVSDQMTSLLHNTSQFDKNHAMIVDEKAAEHHSKSTNLSEQFSGVRLTERIVGCICECSELCDDFVQCASCHTFQHKSCYKLLESQQVDTHICVKCHDPDQGKTCLVPDILSDENRKESALYRQALMFCCNNSQVSCKRIMTHLKVPRKMAEKIFQRLDTDGCFLPATNKSHIRNIKVDLKEIILPRFFSVPASFETIYMESPLTNSSAKHKGNVNVEMQFNEEKENSPPENISPQPKRRRILKTSASLRNSYYSYE